MGWSLSLGAVLVVFLANSVAMGAFLVAILLFSTAGGPAFNAIIYTAFYERINQLGGPPTAGQAVREVLLDMIVRDSLTNDMEWIRRVSDRVEQMPSKSAIHLAYVSMERITDDDTPRTKRLKQAVASVSDKAERRAKLAAGVWEDRIRQANSIRELRRIGWRISGARNRMLIKAMFEEDMKARWFPFGGRFLDYVGRGGAFGLIVGTAFGGDRSNITAWAAWISNVSIVGAAVGSTLFIVACIKDIAYIESVSHNVTGKMVASADGEIFRLTSVDKVKILPDNGITRFAIRFPLLFAPLPSIFGLLLYVAAWGAFNFFGEAAKTVIVTDITVFLAFFLLVPILARLGIVWWAWRRRKNRL